MNDASTHTELPSFFQAILWSYNFSALDPEIHKKVIIVNTINYGDLTHWHWVIGHYGKEAIREFLKTLPASELRPRARRLAEIIFSPIYLHDALRSTH